MGCSSKAVSGGFPQSAGDKIGDAEPDFLLLNVGEAMWHVEAAIIGTRFIGAGFAFEPFGGWMERRKPLWELGPKEGKGGDSAEGSEMTGTGIVANKSARTIDEVEQFADGGGSGDICFAALQPPLSLVGIARDFNSVALLPKALDEPDVARKRPYTDRLAGAAMNQDVAIILRRREAQASSFSEFKAQWLRKETPVFIPVSGGIRTCKRLCQKDLAAGSGKAQPFASPQ